MLEEFIEIVFVILLAQCLEYMVFKKVFDKSKNKIILAHTKATQCNDKPLDNMAWQKTEKDTQMPAWREGNSGTERC